MHNTNRAGHPGFENSEGLRALLTRLHAQGRGGWQRDPDAAALMQYAAEKYASLARKHGLDPWEAAAAAFDAMRTPSVRKADDPWAMVTRAVQVTCIAEERANGLMCSVHQARRPQFSMHHDAERFSDRDTPLADYHPSLRTRHPDDDELDEPDTSDGAGTVTGAVEDAITLFALLGWPNQLVRAAVEHVCGRLTESAGRASAHEALRRDKHARALLDLPSESWHVLLRVLLGHPDPDRMRTTAGRGVLWRLLVGEPLHVLLADDDLVLAIGLASPQPSGRRTRHD